jgi:hypothetical protein
MKHYRLWLVPGYSAKTIYSLSATHRYSQFRGRVVIATVKAKAHRAAKLLSIVIPAVLAFSLLAFGQTSTKKAAPLVANSDRWQKSKECATQGEKLVTSWPGRPEDWKTHYSAKYDKCFVELQFFSASSNEKVFPTLFSTVLVDGFERSRLANSCTSPGYPDCVEAVLKTGYDVTLDSVSRRLNNKPFTEASDAEQNAARTIADKVERDVHRDTSGFCGIDGKAVDCKIAENFISEHMKS